MTFFEKKPDPIELLSFFESEPFYSNEVDHHYGYAYSDHHGMRLVFSYAALEGWIQTIIEFDGEMISQHLSEGVKGFEIRNELKGDFLFSEIITGETITKMEVRLRPCISIKWNTLIE